MTASQGDDEDGRRRRWLSRKPRRAVWRTASGTVAVALVVVGALIGINHGWDKFWFIVAAAVFAGLQIGIQAVKDESELAAVKGADAAAIEAQRIAHSALSGAFTPMLELLAQLQETQDEGKATALRLAMITSVVYAASAVLPASDVRACYFVLEGDQGVPTRLRFEQSAGRADASKSAFEAGTVAGDAAIAMVVNDERMFCRDVEAVPPEGWDGHTHAYRTFLSVPVRGSDQGLGMLTVDAKSPGDLVLARDEPILVVLAKILAASQITADS